MSYWLLAFIAFCCGVTISNLFWSRKFTNLAFKFKTMSTEMATPWHTNVGTENERIIARMKEDRKTFAEVVLKLEPGTEKYESYVRGEWTRHE